MTRLVVCSLEPWDTVWRRNQHLVAGLLAADPSLEVLFVEPCRDLLHDLRSGRPVTRGRGLQTLPYAEGRLRTLQPTKALPRAAGPLADVLLRRTLLRTVEGLGWRREDIRLWVNDPSWARLAAETGWPTLYDITDDWLQAHRAPREHQRLVDNEELLMRTAEAVVVCSPELARTKGERRAVELVPNAVEVARYRAAQPRPADLPAQAAVYVGTLHEDRLDLDLVVDTARALRVRGSVLALVGPDALGAANRARLAAEPNIALLGARPHLEVPAYLQHAAVLVVPHVVDAFTESLDPIKLYEYRAAGRPVVCTPVAGFREAASQRVRVASGDAFAQTVALLASARTPSVIDAGVPDWSIRVDAMRRVLLGLTDGEPSGTRLSS